MKIEELNAVLKEFSQHSGLSSEIALDESGIAQLDYVEGDEKIEVELELDSETGSFLMFSDLGEVPDDKRAAVLELLLIQNTHSLLARGLSAGLSGDATNALLTRTFADETLTAELLATGMEEFISAGLELKELFESELKTIVDTSSGFENPESMLKI